MLDFNGSSGNLNCSPTIPLSYPYWVACYMTKDGPSGENQTAVGVGSSTLDYYTAIISNPAATQVLAFARHPGESSAANDSTGQLPDAAPRLAFMQVSSAGLRSIRFADSAEVVNAYAMSGDPSTFDRLIVGAAKFGGDTTPNRFYNGSVGEVHVGLGTPTSTEITDLFAKTLMPEDVSGHVTGFPLTTYSAGGTYQSLDGTYTLTASGGVAASSATHPISRAAPADTTAPTLTSPSASSTGTTTASGGVTTDEATGTLYRVATLNATESAATVKAGASVAVTAAGAKTGLTVTGLTANTSGYRMHFVHTDAAGNDSAVVSSAQFATPAAGDVTAPTLSAATATQTGSGTASGSVTTNEANGTLYRITTTSASATAAAVKAGASSTVTATGAQAVSFAGLTASTTYYAHYLHRDAAGNDSAVLTSGAFTTAAAPVTGATITPTEQFSNNTGSLLVNKAVTVFINDVATNDRVATKSLTTDATANLAGFNDAALVAGNYRCIFKFADDVNGPVEGMKILAAV